jgi:ribosomal protein S21|tara:strand:- start:703 stop:999 length:297 start_codon:yes stop_codon:yes gene_type:complete
MRRQKNSNFSKRVSGCVTVTADECGGNNDRMIRKFIKKVKKDGIVEEFRSRTHYTKPSVIKAAARADRQRLIDKVNKDRSELLKPSGKRVNRKTRGRR